MDNQESSILLDESAPTDLVVQDHQLVAASNLNAKEVMQQVNHIQEILKGVMKDGEHFGNIPGVPKKILMKAGAEKIGLAFRLQPKYEIERIDLPNFHREYIITCSLYHISGGFVGQGVGSCSSMESKYRYRNEQRVCPACGIAAIIPGKKEYGGGWLCWKKKDGCGAKFDENDQSIISQNVGKIDNPDIADQYNTILKMAKKRAHVDAILTATASSDIFTQDLDENQPEKKSNNKVYYANQKKPPTITDEQAREEVQTIIDDDRHNDKILTDDEYEKTVNFLRETTWKKGFWVKYRDKLVDHIEMMKVPY